MANVEGLLIERTVLQSPCRLYITKILAVSYRVDLYRVHHGSL